jgi:hypothetical protein
MKSAEEFLEKLKNAQVPASSQPRSSSSSVPEMPSGLTSALDRGWYIAPVLAQSRNFPSGALAGKPTNDSVQVRQWWEQYFKTACNWAVEAGARSDLLILEYDYEVGRQMIQRLVAGRMWSWRSTLQFTDPHSRFVCFRHFAQRLRAIGRDFPGVRIHSRSCIFIPPSTYSTGAEVSYLNLGSKVLDVPDWLLDAGQTRNETANRSRDDDEDYFAA